MNQMILKRKNWSGIIGGFIFLFLSFLFIAFSEIEAIPAFARRYAFSCKTCHAPFPRLKDYGTEFMDNGYKVKDQETPRYFIDSGDSLLSLLREVPIALRIESFITYNNSSTKKFDLSAPYIIKLLSGGEINKHISYYLYFFFSERGEVAGLEDAFLMFDNLFNSGFDFYIGQFQVSDPLFKRELRLTQEDYLIYTTKPGQSKIDLTYDRGIMITKGLDSGTDFVVEIVNGSGISEANVFRNYDSDKYKNLLLRLSQDLGKQFRLGAVAYVGKEGEEETANSLWMLGVDGTATSPLFELNFQFILRHDSNSYFLPQSNESIRTKGGFAELIYLPQGEESRWYGLGLFNWVDSDQDNLDYLTLTLHGGWLFHRNFRLTVELSHFERSPYGRHLKLSLGLVTAF
ncbi:MAG: hypothetical protein N3B16_07800 [Candidatus Aminicenantes bacterium]|nr:hypothetical protein [Candidatus Aminicenantes bacterium]